MPLYDYRCLSCGDFRALRPMSESSAPVGCPVCGARSERMIAAPFLAGNDSGSGIAPPRNGPTAFPRGCRHGRGCSH
jgi:putative FmdB family regulatory protein